MIALFFILVVLALYPLAGYPFVVAAVGLIRPRRVNRGVFTPKVTILIPAFNEADVIAPTIENKLAQDYPAELLQIIVVSDCSDDGTDDIVRRYESRGVQLIRRVVRQGKAAALNEAVRSATGEIVVFSDANSNFARDAVSRLVENFADPNVGYVTGCLGLEHGADNDTGAGTSGYLRYENWLRELETRAGSVIGVNGGVDAMRTHLYEDVPADQITDFVLPLRVVGRNLRAIYDPRARSAEEANDELASEFRMRVRVALRALRGLWYMRAVLNPFRHPWAAFCIVSHKILRYLSFVFLVGALVVNVVLALRLPLFGWLLAIQVLLYVAALAGTAKQLPRMLKRVTALPSYYVVSNAAFAMAVVRFLRGEAMATWRPRGG